MNFLNYEVPLSPVQQYVAEMQKNMNLVRELKDDVEHSLLLQEFYQHMRTDKVKILFPHVTDESAITIMKILGIHPKDGFLERYMGGFEEERKDQWAFTLRDISPAQLQKLYLLHVGGKINLCLYSNLDMNSTLCFNIDINRHIYEKNGDPKGELFANTKRFTEELRNISYQLELPSITLKTGNGYHVWFRFTEPIPNENLREFASLLETCIDSIISVENYKKGKLMFDGKPYLIYIHPLSHYVANQDFTPMNLENNSIRLFGCQHCNTGEFTHIISMDGSPMDEADSWKYFRFYMRNRSITPEELAQAKEKATEWLKELQ